MILLLMILGKVGASASDAKLNFETILGGSIQTI